MRLRGTWSGLWAGASVCKRREVVFFVREVVCARAAMRTSSFLDYKCNNTRLERTKRSTRRSENSRARRWVSEETINGNGTNEEIVARISLVIRSHFAVVRRRLGVLVEHLTIRDFAVNDPVVIRLHARLNAALHVGDGVA